ncbi:MAG: DUF4838 domain-containing protein, partial [Clostridia bacterium]|nr:DUF4838 domain-containing protein [Clostridia bacterium]
AATTPIPPRDPAYNVGEIRIGDVSLSEYKVVLPENPSESVAYAADEFIKYIALATGKTLEKASSADKAIYIGCHPDEALGEDGFDIKVDGDDLIISGYGSRGTLYGVYTFLEEYIGWRWLDHDYEIVKVSDFIQIPLDTNDRQIPVFWLRQSFWNSINNYPEYAVKMKCNQLTSWTSDKLGGAIEYTGGLGHTLNTLIPISEYYDEHPEYFQWDGRSLDGWGNPKNQPCLSNPEVYEIVLANVRKILEQNPDARIVSITQNDNTCYCTCANCYAIDAEEESHAGTLIRFVNAIARDIAEDYPNVMIDTFAYQYSRTTPKITRPEENVQIRLCSIECCFGHPLDDPDCRKNRAFMEDLESWSKVCDNLAIWDYTTNFENYCSLFPNLDAIYSNVSIFADHNAKNVMEQGTYNSIGGEFGQLKAYVLAKLLWDPYMTKEEFDYHVADFLEGYYGPGWEITKEVLDLAAEGLEKQGAHLPIFITLPCYDIDPETITRIKDEWADARELALNDAQRLHFDRSYVSILMAEAAYYQYYMMFDRSYTEKSLDVIEEAMALSKALGIRHCETKDEYQWGRK